ncbi:MAG: HIT family protein [Chitinophagales bacterium]|nr:HIT family protein [Chitinophagales bacterium]MDW8428006.1 HIT family protein [Chitinophagales bacterium]
MPSVFTRIVRREIPAHIVAEDECCLAFLDIHPLTRGHVLAIPKKEVDYLFDLDDETLQALFVFCKRVAAAIKAVVPCQRIGVAVVGLEVPHAHVHLIPLQHVEDINFSRPRVRLSEEEMKTLALAIAEQFSLKEG